MNGQDVQISVIVKFIDVQIVVFFHSSFQTADQWQIRQPVEKHTECGYIRACTYDINIHNLATKNLKLYIRFLHQIHFLIGRQLSIKRSIKFLPLGENRPQEIILTLVCEYVWVCVYVCMYFYDWVDKFKLKTTLMRPFQICEDIMTSPHNFKVLSEG